MEKTIKRISILALALVLMLGMTVTSFADTETESTESGYVNFEDYATVIEFGPGSVYEETDEDGNSYTHRHSTDLFPELKNVMPGDTLTQYVQIRNINPDDAYINVYMSVQGVHKNDETDTCDPMFDYEAFLSQMDIVVKAKDADTVYFQGKASEAMRPDEWAKIVELMPAGYQTTLEVTLHVPIEMDNTYQEYLGKLDWKFKFEQFPWDEINTQDQNPPYEEEDVESGSSEAGDDFEKVDEGAQTGDDSNMMPVMLAGLAGLAVALIALLARRRKAE